MFGYKDAACKGLKVRSVFMYVFVYLTISNDVMHYIHLPGLFSVVHFVVL